MLTSLTHTKVPIQANYTHKGFVWMITQSIARPYNDFLPLLIAQLKPAWKQQKLRILRTTCLITSHDWLLQGSACLTFSPWQWLVCIEAGAPSNPKGHFFTSPLADGVSSLHYSKREKPVVQTVLQKAVGVVGQLDQNKLWAHNSTWPSTQMSSWRHSSTCFYAHVVLAQHLKVLQRM